MNEASRHNEPRELKPGLPRTRTRGWPDQKSKSAGLRFDHISHQIELTSRHQQSQRTLLDWLRVEYGIEKPSNKLVDLDYNSWVNEVERIRGKKPPLTAAPSAL